ncbi:MAG: hypothetical protein JO056_09605 [Alphaproteobacteria bacterium]|nr:hypothetical protein [Alphaproteobacteria bacterium]
MKAFLPLAAAALALCVASSATAKNKVSISFDGFCDGLDIILDKPGRLALETGNGCDEGAHFGLGTIGRINNRGNAITFAINLSPKGGEAYQYIFVVDYPLVTGGKFTTVFTQDGKTLSKEGGGTYTVNPPGARRDIAGLKRLIDLRR